MSTTMSTNCSFKDVKMSTNGSFSDLKMGDADVHGSNDSFSDVTELVKIGDTNVHGSNGSFSDVTEFVKMGDATVPKCFVLPPILRPNSIPHSLFQMPTIDLSSLQYEACRAQLVQEVGSACKNIGCFQIINHGIHASIISEAMDVAMEFFDSSIENKSVYASNDVHKPVRYGTSVNQIKDTIQYWRDFIKHYSHPISTWINLWPSNPPTYKKKMGDYARAMQKLNEQLIEVVFESLGLSPKYLHEEIVEGSQVMVVNYYSACPQPELVLGMAPHSDFGYLTIIVQNNPGLEIMDNQKMWHQAQCGEGALIVMLGDQTEIMSNGKYKSLIHRATVSSEKSRISLASLHSLALEQKVGPASELVVGEHTTSYKEGSFGDFLDFISKVNITQARYIDSLKKNTS